MLTMCICKESKSIEWLEVLFWGVMTFCFSIYVILYTWSLPKVRNFCLGYFICYEINLWQLADLALVTKQSSRGRTLINFKRCFHVKIPKPAYWHRMPASSRGLEVSHKILVIMDYGEWRLVLGLRWLSTLWLLIMF